MGGPLQDVVVAVLASAPASVCPVVSSLPLDPTDCSDLNVFCPCFATWIMCVVLALWIAGKSKSLVHS
ncbi:hypothetical protein GOP47_0027338 [Adiantum capillus-veneris]|nr:hypothetical protein GOP47_0027338 [Adiantum capillus-veneris]